MKTSIFKILIIFFSLIFIQACSRNNSRTVIGVTSNISQYSKEYIYKINVKSKNKNKDLLDMNKKMKIYSNNKLQNIFNKKGYKLATSSGAGVLRFQLDMNIVYGNRAVRYFAGRYTDTGRGSVRSMLKILDNQTEEVKYKVLVVSSLSKGRFGGSMESLIKENINNILSELSIFMK